MRALFGVGVVLLVLGVASFFIPVPHHEDHSIKVGDAKIGVQTEHSERVSTTISVIVVVAGVGMIIAGRGKAT
jgi:hypothetical protein